MKANIGYLRMQKTKHHQTQRETERGRNPPWYGKVVMNRGDSTADTDSLEGPSIDISTQSPTAHRCSRLCYYARTSRRIETFP